MRLKNIPGSRDVIAESPYVIHTPEQYRGHFADYFGNTHPIHIEIGTGKGKFITELALKNPDINYIGIEKYSSVLLRAIQKMEVLAGDRPVYPKPTNGKDVAEEEIPEWLHARPEGAPENLLFIRMDAETITDVFGEQEIARIYLNFSDSWPKDRHAKRRLPSRQYFARYNQILIPDGEVCFKTDNEDLFDFSLCEAPEAGWQYRDVTRDLHHSVWSEGNIMTEYEERFSGQGKPICRAVFYR